ncbi:hypothetical protein FNV43_RR01546 [Rhamnella rubrinervis]|uniref:Protein SIEVE ELEMENT OCCLUSION B-like n=1 Tax=Rhamnella rubrinervis TaxID=2594499 RepID=A0A8K0MSD7_9ROSA|nr:hypothetical protein FNV43_RR01546 [Rhamnella rubrinervis]
MLNLTQSVATKVTSTVQNLGEEVLGLFTMSDKKIMDLIYATHVHSDNQFDEDSLFVIVENILKRATQTVDKVVQGSQIHAENIEEKAPQANFSVPLCTLKKIGCELSCKAPGDDVAHKTTLAILNQLSTYSWEAKAVLTLAAFTIEYGEFWLLSQHQHSDQLAKSLAILKRVPILTKPTELQKRRQAVVDLNIIIKTILQVVEIFDEFEKLSIHDPKDIPGLSVAIDHMPVDVYWSILAVAAVSTKLTILTSDEPDKPFDISPYAQKIHYTLNKLKIQLIICRKQLEEAKNYRIFWKLTRTPTEVMEVFKALTFTKDKVQPLIDGSTNKTVDIDVLRKSNVFLFITGLDITDDDISTLKPVYEGTKKHKDYKIVWIPVVEKWTTELQKKFETLRSKMPWFTVQTTLTTTSIKFIKEEWNFKSKPTVVSLNPQGQVENLNALHLIRLWGMEAFPYNKTAEETISKNRSWIGPVVDNIDPVIQTWMKEEKYIFFYGGKDNEWVQQFTKKTTTFANDPIIKEAKINIELFSVGKSGKGGEDHGILGKFWNGIESLFLTKVNKPVDPVTQEIQKLLSYKNESGWALLSKGSTVVIAGHGFTILRAVEEFDKWKDVVKAKGFEIALKEYHGKLVQSVRQCSRLDIPTATGKVPDKMQCPECTRIMEAFVSYKCCHIDGPLSAHH